MYCIKSGLDVEQSQKGPANIYAAFFKIPTAKYMDNLHKNQKKVFWANKVAKLSDSMVLSELSSCERRGPLFLT
jgi:phosphopantetheinyl transferase